MKLLIPKESHKFLFKRVFGHAVFKQVLMYHYKLNGVTEFALDGDGDIVEKVLSKIRHDGDLSDIHVTKFDHVHDHGEEGFLNRFYLKDSYIDVCSLKDIKDYKKKYALEIRLSNETFVAKNINKRISLPLSAVLATQRITPNMITLIGVLWALVGAFCLLDVRYYMWGFVCFQINSLLDGCDGEVARFNFQFSELGKKLDVYADYITTILIVVFEAIGFYLISQTLWSMVVGIANLSLLVLVGVLSLVSQKMLGESGSMNDLEVICHKRLKNSKTLWDRINQFFLFLSRRDFYIFVLFILAILQQFAIIHIYLLITSLSWVLLSVYTLRVLKEKTVKD